MKNMTGDLIEMAKNGEFDVIVHGCNCFNNMGAGIAKTIQKQFPSAFDADNATVKGDKAKVGTYTQATVETSNNPALTIVNAYTQYSYGGGKDHFEYDGFECILKTMKHEFADKRIGFPLIGCGHAGGDKSRILSMIKEHLQGVDVTVVEWLENKPQHKFK